MVVILAHQHHDIIVCDSLKEIATFYYFEIIETQRCAIGKAISPFLSDRVTYIVLLATDMICTRYQTMVLSHMIFNVL